MRTYFEYRTPIAVDLTFKILGVYPISRTCWILAFVDTKTITEKVCLNLEHNWISKFFPTFSNRPLRETACCGYHHLANWSKLNSVDLFDPSVIDLCMYNINHWKSVFNKFRWKISVSNKVNAHSLETFFFYRIWSESPNYSELFYWIRPRQLKKVNPT